MCLCLSPLLCRRNILKPQIFTKILDFLAEGKPVISDKPEVRRNAPWGQRCSARPCRVALSVLRGCPGTTGWFVLARQYTGQRDMPRRPVPDVSHQSFPSFPLSLVCTVCTYCVFRGWSGERHDGAGHGRRGRGHHQGAARDTRAPGRPGASRVCVCLFVCGGAGSFTPTMPPLFSPLNVSTLRWCRRTAGTYFTWVSTPSEASCRCVPHRHRHPPIHRTRPHSPCNPHPAACPQSRAEEAVG